MERNHLGQFLPAPVKVGDMALNTLRGFNPGFTYNKAYKVIATFRCKDRSFVYGNRKPVDSELKNQWEFLVLDDDGVVRRGDLRAVVGNSITPIHQRFSKWEILPRAKPANPLKGIIFS